MHIRLGDRSASDESLAEHIQLLKELVVDVSDIMAERSMKPPLFHIFSETKEPCPSLNTGTFDEFPTWPVEIDQVRN